ncbi:PREDICTED: LOC110772623 [Prunus dulcis]|uniref:PREDICTED: LOC110772623 n=1 Tax=Prunus dulcis TaxID=3755 RepID=A0A5E4FVR2_PRUDU|nr:PREDICTED: LOC110772623 [Prunus dulcis]
MAEEKDEEAHVETINVDAEENLKFIDFDYEQTEEEVDKGVDEDSSWFDRHLVDEDNSWFDRHVVDEDVEEAHVEPSYVHLINLSEEEQDEDGAVRKVRRRKAPRFKQFRREIDLINLMFELGMEFPSLEQCREAIRRVNKLEMEEREENKEMEGEQVRNCENGENGGNG